MNWSPQQDQALKAVAAWIKDKKAPQVFRLFGYAGTGKTTLAQELAKGVKGKVLYAAFTGKAALVMQARGCAGATTIHSAIYTPVVDENTGVTSFELNPASPVDGAGLVIIDECSMVDEDLGADLLSFGTKVLVLGDPAQLPPVRGAGFFTEAPPDIMLTEIHRQARDNPIIALATDVRERRRLAMGCYGASKVIDRPSEKEVLAADQVLVGRNVTRRSYNDKLRRLQGFSGPTPLVGERLVCLRNRRDRGLFNGGIWRVEKLDHARDDEVKMVVSPVDAGATAQPAEIRVHPHFFAGREQELDIFERKTFDEFDFGYCLTVHKAQGSQWDKVIVFDESAVFREDRHRWLYTAITRAAEQITVVMR